MNLAVIGGGPAGLRVAEIAAAGGVSVTLFDAKPSLGRKFLVAGVGGLNLTRAESRERLATRYGGPGMPTDLWPSLLDRFDADALRAWAAGLGIETFVSSSGRVYPAGLKGARLLRRWVARLRAQGVAIQLRHRWTAMGPGSSNGSLRLEFTNGGAAPVCFEADAVVLALGGGSWPQTGSDGAWIPILERMGIQVAPLEPANCGWEVPWSPSLLAQAEGKPLKNIVARAGEQEVEGELLITRYGLEGGALYALGTALRAMKKERGTAELHLDLKPSFGVQQLVAKLGATQKTPGDLLREARSRWRLSDAACALLESRGPFATPAALAAEAKDCCLHLTQPRPLCEAISSAGGVRWSELTGGLMLRQFPGVFVAGEMIDWEAPTGGYLLQGCLATGTRAGQSALEWLKATCGR